MRKDISSKAKVSGAMLAVAVVLSSCLKTEEFPKEPHIEYKSYVQHGDSSELTISFTDGDGDIGLGQGDTLAPYNPGSEWYHNFFVDYYKMVNGEWVMQDFPLPLYYRIPVITPTGQNKALQGDITVEISTLVLPADTTVDFVRFSIHIADRALHESNTVYSDAISTH
jgi:hypothetical protein